MPPRKIRRPAVPTAHDLDSEVSEYLLNRSARERSTAHENKLKAEFMALLAEVGEAQEGGHRVLLLNEPLTFASYSNTGKLTEKEVTGIRRVRRESTALDPEKVMALLEAKKLVEECTIVRRDIDEDAILAANFEGRITDAEMEACWNRTENFAFFLVEE